MRMIPSLEGKHSTLSMHYIKVPKIGSFIRLIYSRERLEKKLRQDYATIYQSRLAHKIHTEHQKFGSQVNYGHIIEIYSSKFLVNTF